ncbi:MAG: hypothetical protein JNL98_39775 [Bryobacterales bacterium]|nr:hypothetical protein [Bryobacterales bacterium]
MTAHFLKEVRNEAADLFVRVVVATVAACVAGVATLVLSDSAPLDEILVNLLGLPILGAMIVRHGRSRVKGAFCEACGVWCEEEDLGVVEPVPLPQIRTALESGDLGALTALLAYDIESQDWEKRIASSDASGYVVDWLRITLHHCSECEKFTALSVTEVRLARTFWSKRAKTTLLGQPKGTDVNRIDRLLITPEKAALLRSHFCSEPEATASTE